MNKYDLLNRVVLSSCYIWIKNHLDETQLSAEIPAVCYEIKTAGHHSLHINRFSQEEANLLKELVNSEEFRPIKETNISLIVMPLEIMRLWIESVPRNMRPHISISDKRLLKGKNEYLMYMLAIKKRNPEMYEKQKDIIKVTSENAKLWYAFMIDKLVDKQV